MSEYYEESPQESVEYLFSEIVYRVEMETGVMHIEISYA